MIGLGWPVASSTWPCASWSTAQSCSRTWAVQSSGIGWPLAFLEDLGEAAAADELHLDVGDRLGAPEVIDGHGVGMVDLGHQPGLALEPPPALLVLGQLGLDQLEGALRLQLEVPDAPDLAHAALADLLDEAVLVEEHVAREAREGTPIVVGIIVVGCQADASWDDASLRRGDPHPGRP